MKMMEFKPFPYESMDYEKMCETYKLMGFRPGQTYLVLGEIENMPGHLAVVNDIGKIVAGMHEENFGEDEGTSNA